MNIKNKRKFIYKNRLVRSKGFWEQISNSNKFTFNYTSNLTEKDFTEFCELLQNKIYERKN